MAIFNRMSVDGDVYFAGAIFNAMAVFTNIQVKGDAMFSGAAFRAATRFEGAQISGRALFGRGQPPLPPLPAASFEEDVSFYRAKIGGDADFFQSLFKKSIKFEGVQVGGTCVFGMATFLGPSLFGGLTADDADFGRAEFKSFVAFDGVHISGNMYFGSTAFGDEAHFVHASVGGQGDFSNSTFRGLTRFDAADFRGSTVFRNVAFLANSQPYFGSARFHQRANFRDVTFAAGANFENTEFDAEATFENVEFRKITTFSNCRFAGIARFGSPEDANNPSAGTTFADVSFGGAKFGAVGDFQRATFGGVAGFRDTSFRVLILSPDGHVRSHDQLQGSIDLRGCTYERLEADWRSVFRKLRPYARQPYVQLEKTLRADGDDAEANVAYVDRQNIERKQLGWGLTKSMDWLWWRASEYGVSPSRLLIMSIGLVLFGAVVLHLPKAVLPGDGTKAFTFWEALWLSTRLFLPVKFEVASASKPNPSIWFVQLLSAVLNIFGWILVPLFIVVVSGMLQYVPK